MEHCPEFWFREAEGRVTALDWKVGGQRPRTTGFPTYEIHSTPWVFSLPPSGTIPPIKSAQGEGDDVKKLFTIGCPVILATLGVALLFVVRKKRKEKRLKRLRGEGLLYQLSGREGGDAQSYRPPFSGPQNNLGRRPERVFPKRKPCHANLLKSP